MVMWFMMIESLICTFSPMTQCLPDGPYMEWTGHAQVGHLHGRVMRG